MNIVKKCINKTFVTAKKLYYEHEYNIDSLMDPVEYSSAVNNIRKRAIGNGKKTYFIIRRSYKGMGLYTYVCIFVSFIAYAIKNNMIPVIDLKNSPNIYLPEPNTMGINAWELFYEQPLGISLDMIPHEEKIVYSSDIFLPNRTPFLKSINDKEEWNMYSSVYRDFIIMNDKTKEYVEQERKKIIGDRKCLGVLCRGTDYTLQHPKNHPVQPAVEEVIKKVSEIIDNYDCIYLATEEKKIFEKFSLAFPGKVLENKRMYYDTLGKDFAKSSIGDVTFERADDNYQRGIEYLSSMYLLSKCRSFIGGACAGTYAAIIMNNSNYDFKYVYDLGYYH